MDLSKRCKEYWGIDPKLTAFGDRIEAADGLFLWPAFEEVVERIVAAIRKRRFLIVVGSACSAKSTAWNEAKRRLRADSIACHVAEPQGIAPERYRDQAIYHAIKWAVEPPDGTRERALRRFREDRAVQCRQLLERENDRGNPVCLAVNDAHLCAGEFLLMAKRLWDDLHGFDRLLSVVLIGQPSILSTVAGIREIDERAEVVRMGGLGESMGEYLHHELARCGVKTLPLDDGAIEQLACLRKADWRESLDHPLMVNNVVSLALHKGWRIKSDHVDRDLMVEAMRAGGREL